MGADPEKRKDAGGNGLNAGNDGGVDRANLAHAGEKGGEGKDGTHKHQAAKGERRIHGDGWLIVKGGGENGQNDATKKHRPRCDRHASPASDDADRDDIVAGEEDGRANAPNKAQGRNHQIAQIAVSGNEDHANKNPYKGNELARVR